jgi:fructosamine-3-kinase
MVPDPVKQWCRAQGYGEVTAEHPVGGGCINSGARLQTASGRSLFLKTNRHVPADMFEREMEGLQALHIADGPRVPSAYLFGTDFLLMEDLSPAPRLVDYWTRFGRKLAGLHNHISTQFGFHHNNYIGSTPQMNPWTPDGYIFFEEQRLLYQARLARRKGLFDNASQQRVERLAGHLQDLIPEQPPSLLHGDLWSGNALSDSGGGPALIDPAVHYGWAEAELAMTALFGSFPEQFYLSYQEIRPLEIGFWDRFPIYNLYHLLNHLNLFGEGYLGQVQSILHRYA